MLNNLSIRLKAFLMILFVTIIGITISCVVIIVNMNKNSLKRFEEQNGIILFQATELLSNRFSNVLEQMKYIEMSSELTQAINNPTEKYIQNKVNLDKLFQNQRNLNNDMIDSILFLDDKFRVYYEYSCEILKKDINPKNSFWYKDVTDNLSYLIWYPSHERDFLENPMKKSVFTIAKYITNSNGIPKGILLINLKESFLKLEFEKIQTNNLNGYFYIIDDRNRIVSSYGTPPQEYKPTYFYNSNSGNLCENDLIITYNTINPSNWKMVTVVDKSVLLKDRSIMFNSLLSAIGFGLLISGICGLIFAYFFTKPLKDMVKTIKKVESGNIDSRWNYNDTRNDEIGEICTNFNSMLDSINELMQKVKKEQEISFSSNLKTLEEQLNSHFLYNILDSIYFLSETGESEKAAEMTASLADFVRHVLNNGQKSTTVDKEINHILNYLNIEKIRYGDKFNFSYSVDKNALCCSVPKLILQPLVENAITHGIFNMQHGIISLNIYIKNNNIFFIVTDNGCGINDDKLNKLNSILDINCKEHSKELGYALQNLRNRLQINYEHTASIKLKHNTPQGCIVELTLPIKEFED